MNNWLYPCKHLCTPVSNVSDLNNSLQHVKNNCSSFAIVLFLSLIISLLYFEFL